VINGQVLVEPKRRNQTAPHLLSKRPKEGGKPAKEGGPLFQFYMGPGRQSLPYRLGENLPKKRKHRGAGEILHVADLDKNQCSSHHEGGGEYCAKPL